MELIITILLAVVAVVMAVSIGQNTRHIKALHVQTQAVEAGQQLLSKEIEITKDAEVSNSTDIDNIIDTLQGIADDIRRLDEQVTKVAKDEKDLKRYYVNYREPKADESV